MRITLGCPDITCEGFLDGNGICDKCGKNGAGTPTVKIESETDNQQTQTSDNQDPEQHK